MGQTSTGLSPAFVFSVKLKVNVFNLTLTFFNMRHTMLTLHEHELTVLGRG